MYIYIYIYSNNNKYSKQLLLSPFAKISKDVSSYQNFLFVIIFKLLLLQFLFSLCIFLKKLRELKITTISLMNFSLWNSHNRGQAMRERKRESLCLCYQTNEQLGQMFIYACRREEEDTTTSSKQYSNIVSLLYRRRKIKGIRFRVCRKSTRPQKK